MNKVSKVKTENLNDFLISSIDIQMAMMESYHDICKVFVNTILEQEVSTLTGERYCHQKPSEGKFSRWGFNPGSFRVGSQRVPIQVPRVIDSQAGKTISLENYKRIREVPEQSDSMIQSVLHGLSMRDYGRTAEALAGSFGLSAASISNEFVEHSKLALKEFNERSFEEINFVSLFIDGKHLAGQQMIIVLGITLSGQKIPMGVVQTSTENHRPIKELLSNLVGRGLNFEDGLLLVIDGSKGLRKAVEEAFGNNAIIQRCNWHKRENVISYLKEDKKEYFRNKLQKAYMLETYDEAKAKLDTIGQELQKESINAYNSLQEGLEETLTIQRLGLSDFSKSFSTTNCIESLNSQVGKYVRNVKRWQTPDQRLRWVVMGLLQSEQRMKKVNNFSKLPEMAKIIKKEIERIKQTENIS